jgi:hypothetical protein
MPSFSTCLAIILLGAASLVAISNDVGMIAALQRKKKGDKRGFSCVAGISLIFCGGAWFVDRTHHSWWFFLPAALDAGTWTVIYLPWFLLYQKLKSRGKRS